MTRNRRFALVYRGQIISKFSFRTLRSGLRHETVRPAEPRCCDSFRAHTVEGFST